MSERKLVKFGVQIEKLWEDQWSFGICLSHWGDETYLYITIFKRSISKGRLQHNAHSEHLRSNAVRLKELSEELRKDIYG